MKLLYFTTANNEENYERIQSQSRVKASVATQVFETALLRGMAQQEHLELTLHSFPMIASFPGSRLLCWGARKESVAGVLQTEWLPTVNLYGLKQFSQRLSAKRALKRWFRRNQNEPDKAVLLYSVYEPIAAPVLKYCRRYGCKCFVIVPDLPRDMYKTLSKNKLMAAFQKRYMKRAVRCQGGFDGYVYLTEAMREVVAPSAPYIVVEGIANPSTFPAATEKAGTNRFAIMYAGAIHLKYGIGNLIEAFGLLHREDMELWLFGSGADAEKVKELASQNQNIRFFGRRSRDEVLAYERQAALLVNVRDPNETFTKYSFPSKTIEYMLSGTPLLTTRLPGIPGEYEKYLIMIDNPSPEAIAAGIERVFRMTPEARQALGNAAASFVAEEKNSNKQAEKILRFASEQLRASQGRDS